MAHFAELDENNIVLRVCVVDNSNVVIATPPTACLTTLNLTYDVPAFKPLFGKDTLKVLDAAVVVKGLLGKIS